MASAANGASIQGVVDAGQPIAGFPVSMGFKDPTGNNQFVTGDALGNLSVSIGAVLASMQVEGKQATGAAITENPVLIAGQFLGNVKLLGLDINGGVTQGQPNAAGTSSWPVQGAGAAGAALVGNPHLIALSDGVNAQTSRQVTPSSGAFPGSGVGIQAVAQGLYNGGSSWVANATASILGDAAGLANTPGAGGWEFNGTTWDRHRNNIDVTHLASASRTTTQGPTSITTYNARAIYIVLDMTVVGTGSVTLSVDMVDPASAKRINLLTGAAVVANGTNIYKIGVGLTAAANLVVSEYLPRTIAITVTANNANAATYSVGYSLIAA